MNNTNLYGNSLLFRYIVELFEHLVTLKKLSF